MTDPHEHPAEMVGGGDARDVLLTLLAERSPSQAARRSQVSALAAATAERLERPAAEIHAVRLAAELRDVGSLATPDAILAKPGPLDEEEWAVVRRQPLAGARVLAASPQLAVAAPLVRSTRERVDGSGYPDGLRGDAIPLGARIVAVVEAFEAMVCERAYRTAFPVDAALGELRRCAGTQFDPGVIWAFMWVLDAWAATPRAA
jgi:two-component system cell cycle response regulator